MDLRKRLEDELRRNSNYNGHAYFPAGSLAALITRQNIYKALGDIDEELVGRILCDASRVFAILVLIERKYHIFDFLDRRLCDDLLPIGKFDLPDFGAEDDRDKFYRLQFHFPPIFERHRHLELLEQMVLPFLRYSIIDNGSFGYVYKVKVAQGHLPGSQNNVVALKSVTKGENDSWQIIMREAETLRQRSHPHIVPLLASFVVNGVESGFETKSLRLLFPFANMNMEIWMNLRETPQHLQCFERQDRRDFLYQSMYSLVSALSYLHRELDGMITSHHDLKPKNILLEGDKLKIADFGRSHLIPLKEGSDSEGPRGTYTYHPPEYYNDDGSRAKIRHGRAFDAWSMACILTEMATLVVYGWSQEQYVGVYRRRRLGSSRSRELGKLKEPKEDDSFHNHVLEVYEWIAELKIADGSRVLEKCLQIAEAMFIPAAKDRLFLWEAELDFFDLLHPDNGRISRLEKGALCVQSPGPKAQVKVQTPLHRAVLNDNLDRVRQLLMAGWSTQTEDRTGRTPTQIAQATGSADMKMVLLEAQKKEKRTMHKMFDVQEATEDEFVNLIKAIKSRSTDTVLEILNWAENPTSLLEQTDEDGLTPLHWAARFSTASDIAILLTRIDNPEKALWARDDYGNCPIHDACEDSSGGVVAVMLDCLTDTESLLLEKGSNGRTPLHCTALGDNVLAAEELLRLAANPYRMLDVEDDNGKNPLKLAVQRGHKGVEDLVRRYAKA